MIKKIKKWLGYRYMWHTVYEGTGYLQGIGFDLSYETFEIEKFGIRIITRIKINTDMEWLEKLKNKLDR